MSERAPLQKAADADLHPSTPAADPAEPSLLRAGATAGDAVGGPDRDRPVKLVVKVPKSLRRKVRKEAKRRGVSVDAVVADALRRLSR